MAAIMLWKPRKPGHPGEWVEAMYVDRPVEFVRLVGAPGTDGDAETSTMDWLARAICREFKRPVCLKMGGKETVIDEF